MPPDPRLPLAPFIPAAPEPSLTVPAPRPGAGGPPPAGDEAALRARDAELAEIRAQLDLERRARQEERAAMDADKAELGRLRQEQARQRLGQGIDYGQAGLVQLAPEEAGRVIGPVVGLVHDTREELRKEFQDELRTHQQTIQRMTESAQEAQAAAARARMEEEILQAVPGAMGLVKDPAFLRFRSIPVTPNANLTYGNLLYQAYNGFNAKGVIDVLSQYAEWARPRDLADIAQVGSAAGPGPAAVPGPAAEDDMFDARRNLLLRLQTGKIDKRQFREGLDKLKAGT
jgi:hypothetical protein